ncbi:MAG: arginase family protein [Microbacteriaceae bacterium]
MALAHDELWPRAGNWPAAVTGNRYDFAVVGVPTWSTSLSPGHAYETPGAVRDAVRRYSHVLADGTDTTGLTIADFGDIADPDTRESSAIEALTQASQASTLLVAIGGDNALTVPVALGSFADARDSAGLITVDAHLDVRDGVSNGSPVRRLVEEFGVDPTRVVQIGIADFANSTAYLSRVRDWGVTVITRDDVARRGVVDVAEQALAIAGSAGGPIHVDLDIDACDRSVVPACPASIPGGLSAYEMRQFARVFATHSQVKSIDLAEVDARTDSADGRTVRLTALLILEALAGLAAR